MIDKSNHGQIGRALYLRFTPEKFKEIFKYYVNNEDINIGDTIEIEECSIPIYIVDSILGDYECVCEFGIEVHELGD